MLQVNSTINHYNTTSIILLNTKLPINISVRHIKKNKIYVPIKTLKEWDILNKIYTGIIHKNIKSKILALQFFIPCFLYQWARIKFRGKSFRVRNFCNKKKLTLNFGYSHWTKLKFLKFWAFFKKKRQNYIIYTFQLSFFLYFRRFLPFIKTYNCYTMRGLRFKKQGVIKRFGKISQHISSLH